MNVSKLNLVTTPPAPVDEDVVALLKRLLADAEAGEFNGIATITIRSNGAGSYIRTGDGWAGAGINENMQVAIGAVALLETRLVAHKLSTWGE